MRRREFFLPVIFVAAVFKLLLLIGVGPSIQPDSPGYIGYADEVLSGVAFHPFDFNAAALPGLAFRMAGYPLVIAGAKLLSHQVWPHLMVLLQDAATLLVASLMFVVLRHVFASKWLPYFVTIAYLFSESLLWDNAILSDSLYSNIFNAVIFILLGAYGGYWRLRHLSVLGLGIAWGLSLLLRDSGTYFVLLPVLLLFGYTRRDNSSARRTIALFLSFIVPVACIMAGYTAFNWYRTGEPFFGITGVANWLRPVFDMAGYGYARPFDGNDIVSAIMRGQPPVYDFPAQIQFLEVLHTRCGCNALAMESIVFHKYVVTILQHPIAYLAVIWHNFNYIGLGSLLTDPVFTLNQFVELGTSIGHRIVPALSTHHLRDLAAQFSIAQLLLMVLATISTTVSTALFSLLILGIPYFAIRDWKNRKRWNLPMTVACFSWFGFVSVSLAFSMIHYEARHALPLLPLGLTGIGYGLSRLAAARRNRSSARAAHTAA